MHVMYGFVCASPQSGLHTIVRYIALDKQPYLVWVGLLDTDYGSSQPAHFVHGEIFDLKNFVQLGDGTIPLKW